ncbi:MAG: D-alanyl-D-alanine carboxypeptidase/D-alanyl-D-alanine-endopeptidase, partial [Spirochaetota bacterium]
EETVSRSVTGREPSAITIGPDTTDKAGQYLAGHFDPDNIGFIVYDLESDSVLFSHNRKRTFIPASCAKIPTVIHALDTLGGGHRFTTKLVTDGMVRDGILNGNLYLHGTGDPSLDVSDIIDMVNRLKRKGIHSVSGSFHYDRSHLTRIQILDETMDLDQSYNTGVAALSTEHNYIDVRWSNNREGEAPEIILTPDLPMFAARRSRKKTGEFPEKMTFEHRWEQNRSVWELSPDASVKGQARLPVRLPSLYTAQLFTHIARIHGIDIPWPTHGLVPGRTTVLVKHEGKSVEAIAESTMHYSLNIHAELLFLATARKLFGEKATYSESARLMELYTRERFSGVDWNGYSVVNGSGLSSKNRISPEQMLALLIYADSREFGARSFSYFLQPSGWNYSLRNRFSHNYGAFRIYAKTGMINYAVGLAGYLHTYSGKHLLFAFFNSNEYLRYLHEQNPERYGEKAYDQACKWKYAYRAAMDRIIETWITSL